MRREIDAQIAITAEFGKQASKAVGDYAQTKLNEAVQADAETDPDRKQALSAQAKELEVNWGDTGVLRVAAHALIGGLTGGVGGAVGAAAGTLTAPTVAQALRDAGIDGPLAQTLTALSSTAAGAALGGTAGEGAAAALNEVANNYLKHADVEQLAKKIAACGDDKSCKDKAIAQAYVTSAINDVALLNCKATNNCDAITAEYRKGYAAMEQLIDQGIAPNDVARIFNLENNAQMILRNGLEKVSCASPQCKADAQLLIGMTRGLTKITPVGLVVGAGMASYSLTTALIENGLTDTAVAVAQGIGSLPQAIYDGLRSDNPQIRGEALVDALTLGTVATAVAVKVGAVGWTALSKAYPGEVAGNINAGFKTLGVDVGPQSFAAGREMIDTLKAVGLSADEAEKIVSNLIKTGATVPTATGLKTGDQLVKLVPTGSGVGPTSPYWLTQAELTQLAKEPAKLAERLGLPPGSQAPNFDIYVIQAKQSVTVFESTVAKTADTLSGATQSGGANQTLVLDRSQFTQPIKVGTLRAGG